MPGVGPCLLGPSQDPPQDTAGAFLLTPTLVSPQSQLCPVLCLEPATRRVDAP